MIVDLAEFLLARIAEDEALARAASPGPWHLNAESTEVLAVDDITVCEGFALSGPQTRATTEHIARHDPARVIAECTAKRRIVEEAQNYSPELSSGNNGEWAFEVVLRRLALPYSDHPEYRQEWRW